MSSIHHTLPKLLALLSVCFLFSFCTKKSVDSSIALCVDQFQLTHYEVNKQLSRSFGSGQVKNKKNLTQFKNEIIATACILADAYNKRYDTLPEIQKNVHYVSDFMMTQKYGYLWNNAVTPIINEFAKPTAESLEKRASLYYFDILEFTDKQEVLKFLNFDTVMHHYSDFVRLKEQGARNKKISSSYLTLQWPFSSFHSLSEYLYTMRVGEVSCLLHFDNTYYYFYLDRKEAVRMDADEEQKLIDDLTYFKELAMDKAKDFEILEKAQPRFHIPGIDSIAEYLLAANELAGYAGNNLLLNYQLNGQEIRVHLTDLLEPLHHYPIAMGIGSKADLLAALNQHIFTAYLVEEAKSLNLYNDTQFTLDQRFYMNTQVYYEYIKNEFRNKVSIDSSAVKQYYEQNRSKYSRPEAIYYSCYLFATAEDAANNRNAITNFYQSNPVDQPLDRDEFPNISSSIENYRLDSTSQLSQMDIYKLSSIQFGELSDVVCINNQFGLLLRKHTEGVISLPLKKVYDDIVNNLTNEYVENKLKERLLELKSQYQITDNIDINEWL